MRRGDPEACPYGKSEWAATERAWYRFYLTEGRRREFPGREGKPGLPPECELVEVAIQSGLAPWELAEHPEWQPILAARVSARNRYLKYQAEKTKT